MKGAPRSSVASVCGVVCAASLLSAAPRTITGIVASGDVKLAATLDLPDGPGSYPVVVVLHTSGAGERAFTPYRHLGRIPGTNHFMATTTDAAHDSDPEPVAEEYTRLMTEWLASKLGSAK